MSENTTEAYGWLSPRISFSTDFVVLDKKGSPRREEQKQIEFSHEFEFSLSIEYPAGSPADEIFYEGKIVPLQFLPSTKKINLIKELMLEEDDPDKLGVRSSADSDAVVSCGSPSPTCSATWKEIFGLGKSKRGIQSLKLLLSRQERPIAESATADSAVSRSSSDKETNSRRIMWKNLERCSEQHTQAKRGSARKRNASCDEQRGSSGGSFSGSNVRVAPVLNVPICMGSKEPKESKSTISGLRKLLKVNSKKASLQRVTWACPGGAI